MSGTIRSQWYRVTNNIFPAPISARQTNKNVFSAIVKYFDAHPGFSRLASFYGRSAPTTGDYGSGLGPMTNWTVKPQDGCWAVWRAVSASVAYDIAIIASDAQQIADYTSPWVGEGPVDTAAGVFAVAAYHSGGAWNGTTSNNGLDSFTTPWKLASQTTIRCNGTSGGNNASRNAVGRLTDTGGSFQYDNKAYNVFITGDNDTIFFGIQSDKGAKYELYSFTALGIYQPASGSYNVPITQFKLGADQADGARGNTVGSTTSGSGGGGINTVSGSSVRAMRLEYPSFMLTNTNQLSKTLEEDKFWEFPVRLYSYETSNYMYCGMIDSLRVAALSAGGSFRFHNTKTRLLLPAQTSTDSLGKYLVVCLPWNSSVLSAKDW